MTTHLDEELLADWALGDEAPDPAAADHLHLCARCRQNLAELRGVVGLTADLPRLERPALDVWQRTRDELGLAPEGDEDLAEPPRPAANRAASRTLEPGHEPVSAVAPGRRASGFRRSSLALAAGIAAVLGIGAGVGVTLALTGHDDKPSVEAVIRLEPLRGKTGDGSADLVRSVGGSELRVSASGLKTAEGFYEVWLINTDGKRMVSLGVLNPQDGGTFQIPGALTSQGYRIVDISLEPDDGNPEHSHNSIIRGTLPA